MIKKMLYAMLFIFLGATLLMYTMEQHEQPTLMEVDRSFIDIQKAPEGQELELPEAAVIRDGIEYLDTSKDEPILFQTFSELINSKAKYGVPFILAVVSLHVPSKSCCMGSTVVRHAYYEAIGLNTALFGNIELNAQTNNFHYYKNGLNMAPDKMRDPFTKLLITNISYFIIEPGAGTATFLARDFDLFVNSPAQQFLVKLFNLHTNIAKELNARETNPAHSLDNLYLLLIRFGVLYKQQNKLQEAEHYYKQAEDQNVDLETKAKASYNLGTLYAKQNNLQEAEPYLKQAADQNVDLKTKARASYNLGFLYEQQNNLQEAEHYYTQAANQIIDLDVQKRAQMKLAEIREAQSKEGAVSTSKRSKVDQDQ